MSKQEENKKLIEQAMKEAELREQAMKINMGGEAKEGVQIDFTTEDGNVYNGVVVFKRPTMIDYMKMGAEKSEILRRAGIVDVNLVDNSVKFMAHVMATLKTTIVKCPSWLLNLDDIVEPELLYHVYGKYEEFEDSFRKSN